jgi:hypothetical protein
MMLPLVFTTLAVLALAVGAVPSTNAQGSVKDIRYYGDGCPDEALTIDYNNDRTTFSVQFGQEHDLSMGKKKLEWPRRLANRFCTFELSMDTPANRAYRLNMVNITGSVTQYEGTVSAVDVIYWYPFDTIWLYAHRFFGAEKKTFNDDFPTNPDTPGWSNCGDDRVLYIQVQTVMRNNTAAMNDTSQLHVSGLDNVQFEWRDC